LLPVVLSTAPTGREESPRRIALGVYQHGAPWELHPLDEFEALAERPVEIVMWYQDWAQTPTLDLRLFERVAQRGAVPLLTWEPWDHTGEGNQPAFHLSHVLAGEFDQHVRAWAEGLAAYGAPVLLRWAHEMNGAWYPWGHGVGGTTPAQYRATWQRLRSIFQDAGADQVQWVWSPNILEGADALEEYYPGDEWVDWLALDGYNWGGWGQWRSFARVFTESYRHVTALSTKPLMIAEVACAESRWRKARWITDALTVQLPLHFPRVEAVIWFNSRKEHDWRIESDPASRRAFAQAVAAPLYQLPPRA
jgi:mannan endo-1,4-beta-mannosidase